MICQPGLCIKCGKRIMANGRATASYNELVCQMTDGSLMAVACCSDCKFEEGDHLPMVEAINDNLEANGVPKLEKMIISIVGRKNMVEILREIQGGKCPICHEEIGNTWIITNGEMRHELCSNANHA